MPPLTPERLDKQLEPNAGKRLRVVVSGYYGFGNLGDDLILKILVENLLAMNTLVTVICENPRQMEEQYSVRAINRMDIFELAETMSNSNLLVSGGGGLFQDVTGLKSVLYYGAIVLLAKFFEVPSFFWAQGIGPLRSRLAKFVTGGVLQTCRRVTVRDLESAKLAASLTGEQPEVTADPVWTLKVPDKSQRRQYSDTWNIGLSLRQWPVLTEARIESLVDFFRRLTEEAGRPVCFYLLSCCREQDDEVLKLFEEKVYRFGVGRCQWLYPHNIADEIGSCHVMFGMRLHSLILGILANVPVYGLVYDPKVRSLLDELGLGGADVSEMARLDEEKIRDYFSQYELPDLSQLQRDAFLNIRRLEELLESIRDEILL